MQTIVRRAVILRYHWIVWFKWILSARKPPFRSFFPLDRLSLSPFHNYFQATSLCTLSAKQHLACKNPYYSHQPKRRKTSILNHQRWLLLSSLSYRFHKKIKKTGQHHIRLFTSYEVQHQESGLQQVPEMDPSWKRFSAIPSPKRRRRVKFNTKEKSCRSILLYLRGPKASNSPGSCEWQGGTAASHTPAARGWRVQVGAACHRKKTLLLLTAHCRED